MRHRVVALIPLVGVAGLCLCLFGSSGCKEKQEQASAPVYRLAWSEYPSWSVFGVASELGLIDGGQGKQGELEKKWGVDIVLDQLQYNPSIQKYRSESCDAVCITNIDVLAAAATRKTVAILPTSTSVGADACLVVGIEVPKDRTDREALKKAVIELRKHKVYGLKRSVSEYAFDRNLELLGEDPKKYRFTDEPPDRAARAMQLGKPDHNAIMVWNPFALRVLRENTDARRLFDSSTIPEEIIDMVVVAQDALDREKGKEFACCIIDCFYEINRRLWDPDQEKADRVLRMLGEKFSRLGLEDMRTCLKETRFYKGPREGVALFAGKKLPQTMKTVTRFCLGKDMIKTATSCGFGARDSAPGVQLRFDPSYIEQVRDRE
jgi:ABC-type nitrate/sulfonate/bicarbonate transport system substrate-binding protein